MTNAPFWRAWSRATRAVALLAFCGGCAAHSSTPPAADVADTASTRPPELRIALPDPGARAPSRGLPDSPVVVHVFSDFECPFCEEVQPTLEQLDAEFPGKLRFIWHNLPLPLHSQARALARASLEAFAEQGNPGFWRIHDFLWKTPDPSPEGVRRYAREHHFDEARFEQALAGTRHDAEIDRDIALAHEHGITATPSFVINGVLVVGAQPIEEFREVVQLALDLHQ